MSLFSLCYGNVAGGCTNTAIDNERYCQTCIINIKNPISLSDKQKKEKLIQEKTYKDYIEKKDKEKKINLSKKILKKILKESFPEPGICNICDNKVNIGHKCKCGCYYFP